MATGITNIQNMAITKRPSPTKKPDSASVEKFIGKAPDAREEVPTRKSLMRGKREQISHTMPPDLLEKVDEMSKRKGITRAGLINLAISEYCEKNS